MGAVKTVGTASFIPNGREHSSVHQGIRGLADAENREIHSVRLDNDRNREKRRNGIKRGKREQRKNRARHLCKKRRKSDSDNASGGRRLDNLGRKREGEK